MTGDVRLVGGHGENGLADAIVNGLQEALTVSLVEQVGQRMRAAGQHALTDHHL